MSKLGDKIGKAIDTVTDRFKAAHGKDTTNSVAEAEKDYATVEAAKAAFEKQKKKLLSGKGWSDLSGPENAVFILCNAQGVQEENDMLQVGKFLKIDLPGPLPMYWVRVENISEGPDRVEVTVRPSKDPSSKGADQVTAHFFRNVTVNILSLERQGLKLIARQEGVNEIANNEEPEAGGQAAINTGVAAGGMAGVAQWQWTRFTNNLAGK